MLNITIILLIVSIISFCITLFYFVYEQLLEEEPEDFEQLILAQLRKKKQEERIRSYQKKFKKSYTITELNEIRNNVKEKESISMISSYCYETKPQPVHVPVSTAKDSEDIKHLKLSFNYINNYHHNSKHNIPSL